MVSLNPTVFVVDRDAAVRASLEAVIRRAGWTPQVFASAEEFLLRPPLPVPSALVLEIGLADFFTFDLLRHIAAERKATPIIAVAGHADIPTAVRAMQAGAADVLVKPLTTDALLAAIEHSIVRSRVVLDQDAELLNLRVRYGSLSSREQEVMARVVAGFLNKRIGAALGISEITVKAHRGKVMRKMGADSLAELVVMAISLGLPTPSSNTLPLAVAADWLRGEQVGICTKPLEIAFHPKRTAGPADHSFVRTA